MKEFFATPADDVNKILYEAGDGATIYLSEGIYRQKIEVCRDGVKIIGKGAEKTRISYGDYARKADFEGKELGTFRTYTLCVTGNGVTLRNLTVENSNTDPKTVGQCVSLSVHGDMFHAADAAFVSTQDTLFLAPFPDDLVVRYRGSIPERQLYREGGAVSLFENCTISGTVDFIFGCGEAYFSGCDLISLNDGRNYGFIAAPAHSLKQERGFCFVGCRLLCGGAAEGSVYLARPWRDFGKCMFADCDMDAHINRALFDKWNDTPRDRTARFLYGNLRSSAPLAPVGWAKEADSGQADAIIARIAALKSAFNEE